MTPIEPKKVTTAKPVEVLPRRRRLSAFGKGLAVAIVISLLGWLLVAWLIGKYFA